jgi:hypothetical protein
MDSTKDRLLMNQALPRKGALLLAAVVLSTAACERRPKLDYDCSPGNYRQQEGAETWCLCVEYHWRCDLEGSGYEELVQSAAAQDGSAEQTE